jgi:carbonic anhydrase
MPIHAQTALAQLREGNRRFAAGQSTIERSLTRYRRMELRAGQEPFAIIFGCSDSRVPAEIVFDQGLGELFVIRVAGNVVAPSLVGSVEFAAQEFGTRLVLVLGHTLCGAVTATVNSILDPTKTSSKNLTAITDRIKPSLAGLPEHELHGDRQALIDYAVRANVRMSMNHLHNESAILQRLQEDDGLIIAGGVYSLETGHVDFF